MEKKEKKTVGQVSYDLKLKEDEEINPIDLQRAIHKGNESEDSFENQINVCVERGMKLFEKDFFVTVMFKKERLLTNVVRQYFMPRESCPTPTWDQIVYHYHRKADDLEFLWVIPDKSACKQLSENFNILDPEQESLGAYVLKFKNGELDKLCEKLNLQIVA